MPAKRRDVAYDFVRAVAMMMIVAIHARPASPGALGVWYAAAMQALLFPANVVFFMMSGRLNMRIVPDDKLGDYYRRKFTGVLLPILVYMLAKTLWNLRAELGVLGPLAIARIYVANALGDFSGTAYWFVFSLFGMLLATPLLAPAFVDMSPGRKRAFVVLFLLFCTPHMFLCRTAHSFNWQFQLGAFFGSYLLGSVIDLEALLAQPRWKLLVPTLGCMVASTVLLWLGFPHHPINDNTPMYYVAGAGMFVLLYALGRRVGENSLVSVVARYSFGVYLCHDMFLELLRPAFGGLVYPVQHVALTLVAAACALAFAMVVDTLVVGPLQKALRRQA